MRPTNCNQYPQLNVLRQDRGVLEARVLQMAAEHDMPTAAQLLDEAPPHIKNRRFWHYFSPKRRRKVEWGEVRRSEAIALEQYFPLYVLVLVLVMLVLVLSLLYTDTVRWYTRL